MNLTIDQLEDIAYLKEEKAFKIVLKALEEEIEYTSEIMTSFDDNIDVKILPYWKALKKILFILTTYPETVAQELENYRKDLLEKGMEDILLRKPSAALLSALKKEYELKKKQMEEVV